jgi:hypothetical protein
MAELLERAGAEAFASAVARMLAEAAPILDERQRRVLMGAGARQLGRGGIKLIAAATGASADTVGRGAAEVEAGLRPPEVAVDWLFDLAFPRRVGLQK